MFADALELRRGVTAVIGGGGKTALLRRLGEELSQKGSVLLCTTTKIYPWPDLPCGKNLQELEELKRVHPLLFGGTLLEDTGKLTALPCSMEELAECFDYVLVEADGSAGRPMKAHASHEPVIPPGAQQTILVVGASGFGSPIADAAHRPEIYARLAGAQLHDLITPRRAAEVVGKEALHTRVFINQTDDADAADVRAFAALVNTPAAAGSLWKGELVCLL